MNNFEITYYYKADNDVDIQPLEEDLNTREYAEFVNQQLTAISETFGIPYELLGENYNDE